MLADVATRLEMWLAGLVEPTSSVDLPMIELAQPGDVEAIRAAIQLGNVARRTLGHLPYAAYEDAVAKGGLLLAREDGAVIAYALFASTARRVRLTHLCVSEANRGSGIARELVEWISNAHADRPGILVWCRRDYGLGKVWAKLGFARLGERPGRGKEQKVLVAWWRDHGHPQLFARDPETALVRASIDLNVLRDLADIARPDRPESLALFSDQIADRLEVVRTPALDVEIDAMDDSLRVRCMREAGELRAVRPARDLQLEAEAVLVSAAKKLDPTFLLDDQGRADIRYVSEAIASEVNVFITRDERLMGVLGASAEAQGIRILRPAEVVVHIDELVSAGSYQAAALQQTDFKRTLIRAGREGVLDTLVSRQAGERLPQLRHRIRALTSAGLSRVGVYSGDDQLVAAYVTTTKDGILDVPFLRVAPSGLADTIARQLLFVLRQAARQDNHSVIRLTDPFLSRSIVAAAIDDGFLPHDGVHYAFVIDVCGDSSEIHASAAAAARIASLPVPPSVRQGLLSVVAAEVERVWWPAKMLDSMLLTYLVPIRQSFSSELLGVPGGLFHRPAALGLSREHVYYRSPLGPKPKAPARLMWYMSGSSPGTVIPAGVIAASQLEEVVEGSAGEMHTRFRHLGVWREEQIDMAARGGVVQALRFANTELFPETVPLSRLKALGQTAPQGPLLISKEAFGLVYREGQRIA